MKLHLAASDDPLPSGRDQDAACGAQVPKAVFLFMFDMGSTGVATVSSLLCCQKCSAQLKGNLSKRFLYALGNGEELIHEGDVG